ncbi:adenylate cyclase [Candidatus Magnetomorum sp. HK-1]|nr:adenylate cyclase [Candidatus Magnetomorum sp. HK-1]
MDANNDRYILPNNSYNHFSKNHILVIKDNSENLHTFLNELEQNYYKLTYSYSIIDALKLISSGLNPDLILLANIKSLNSAIENIKDLRQQYPIHILPIIVISQTKHSSNDIVVFFHAGINDYISAPFFIQEIISRIQTHIQITATNIDIKKISSYKSLKKKKLEEKVDLINEQYHEKLIKLLLIDDQGFLGKIMSKIMESENDIDFYFCQDERKAIETAEKIIPDVIIQDLELPNINGLTLLALYAQNRKLSSIPVIILTTLNDPSSRTLSYSLGAKDYILKPPNSDELLARIRYHAKNNEDITNECVCVEKSHYHYNSNNSVSNPEQINIINCSTSGKALSRSPIKVLLVDDQAFIGKVVEKYLENENDITYYFCQDPMIALDIANKIHPTVIIQDLTMPKIDGLSMISAYRNTVALKRTPLIVFSSQDKATVKNDAFTLGANDYIVKPPDKIELIARIRYHSKAYNNMLQLDEAYKEVKHQRTELEIRNNFIKKTFGRYLSDNIVSSILDTPEGLELGGEKRNVTILMSDIRGFTKISEQLSPEAVLSILNIYLEVMTEVIMKYNGTIDEFIGDAILVIFGAPFSKEDDTIRAIACALEMQLSMDKVNNINLKWGYPELEMGIGINTGEVIVGNIGSDKRSKYGIVGSNVNLTSRIESYTVGGQILISENTYQQCYSILKIDNKMNVMPKGVKSPINLYSIIGIEGDYQLYLPNKKDKNLKAVENPIDVQVSIIDGKDAGTESCKGKILKLSEKYMDIKTDIPAEKFSNLKISLTNCINEKSDGVIYAKVVECIYDEESTFRVNLTSISKEAKDSGIFQSSLF